MHKFFFFENCFSHPNSILISSLLNFLFYKYKKNKLKLINFLNINKTLVFYFYKKFKSSKYRHCLYK